MDHLNEIKKLREAVIKVVTSLNLELEGFAVIPSDRQSPDRIEMSLHVTPEALMSLAEREQKGIDEVFMSMMSEFPEPDPQKSNKIRDIKSEIEKWMTEE